MLADPELVTGGTKTGSFATLTSHIKTISKVQGKIIKLTLSKAQGFFNSHEKNIKNDGTDFRQMFNVISFSVCVMIWADVLLAAARVSIRSLFFCRDGIAVQKNQQKSGKCSFHDRRNILYTLDRLTRSRCIQTVRKTQDFVELCWNLAL